MNAPGVTLHNSRAFSEVICTASFIAKRFQNISGARYIYKKYNNDIVCHGLHRLGNLLSCFG
jgi:hypothetical protein